MRQGGGVRETGVGAAQFGRYPGVQPGESAYVQLVDHRVRPGGTRAVVVRPVVLVVHDHALGDVRRRVAVVTHGVGGGRIGPVAYVPVHLGGEREVAVHRPRVRVEQQLRRIPAGAAPRVPAAADPVAVPLGRGAHRARSRATPRRSVRSAAPGSRRPPRRRDTARRSRRRPPTARSWCRAWPSGPVPKVAPSGSGEPGRTAAVAGFPRADRGRGKGPARPVTPDSRVSDTTSSHGSARPRPPGVPCPAADRVPHRQHSPPRPGIHQVEGVPPVPPGGRTPPGARAPARFPGGHGVVDGA